MQLSITQMILHAGPIGQTVMVLLLFFSIVSWSIIFMKGRLFRNVRLDSEDFQTAFWSSKTLSEASEAAEEFTFSPEAAVFKAGFAELKKINAMRSRNDALEKETLEMQMATMDNLKRALRKAETEQLTRLGSLLPFLATTGSATPFIGLFGTVWGIMVSFHDIGQRGSASLAVVAPGISEALVVTAAGLAAAIPAVIFYNFYANKLSGVQDIMQNFSTDFLNLVERDLLSRI